MQSYDQNAYKLAIKISKRDIQCTSDTIIVRQSEGTGHPKILELFHAFKNTLNSLNLI